MPEIGLRVEKKRTLFQNNSVRYLLLWTAINLSFLVIFPFMHTDEAWLAGLSRAIIAEGNAAATESFFNLEPRAPHAVKILFHFIQIFFIKIFGYSLFSIRLFSLLTGAASAAVFGMLCGRLGIDRLIGIILLSIQIQFLYASHFGRQEIQLLLLMLLSLYLLYSEKPSGFIKGLFSGLPIALAVGFHPNVFIIAWPSGLILLSGIIRRRRTLSEGAGFLLLPAVSAIALGILSIRMNSNFVSDYAGFGETVGVFNSLDVKLLGFDDFYRKLFIRVSGTYYTPEIRPVFALTAVSAIWITVSRLLRRNEHTVWKPVLIAAAGIIGVNTGIILLGKYSAPSVLFVVPFLVLSIAAGLSRINKKLVRRAVTAVSVLLLSLNSFFMVLEEAGNNHESYADFLKQIESTVPALAEGQTAADSRVLGPLTAEFGLEYGRLLDWRNLTMLNEAGLGLEQYINDNHVEYIIYIEEYEVIYRDRPVWNVLYGNPVIYHEQMQNFLKESCELINEFDSPGYGTRIVMHRFKQDWWVKIYRVINP